MPKKTDVGYVKNIPVSLGAVIIGSAEVDDDGTIILTLGEASATGRELYNHFLSGFASGLSINPIVHPAAAREALACWCGHDYADHSVRGDCLSCDKHEESDDGDTHRLAGVA